MLYDIVIIGGGPAGLSAAITARARNKKTLIISNPLKENPLASSQLLENYPGMPSVTGLDLLKTMHKQAKQLGAEFFEARALSVVPLQKGFSVTTSSVIVETRSAIIAVGAVSGGKPYKGEIEYLGKGVSYCATCDGMLFRFGTVLIVGLNTEAVEEANFMAEIGATVHFIAKEMPAGLDPRIQKHAGKLLSLSGDALGVTHALLYEYPQEGEGAPADKCESDQPGETQLEVNGVFILRPGVAPTSMLPTLETEGGYIKVDAGMRTNIRGVFAAGDCIGKPMQVATAVGEGQVAAFSAVGYLVNADRKQ